MTLTKAAKRLRAFLQKREITQSAAAEGIGVSAPTMHDWLVGTKRPREHHRQIIEKWTDSEVTAVMWLTAAEASAVRSTKPLTGTDG